MNSICRLKQTRGNTYNSDGLLQLVVKQSQRAFANKTALEQNKELIRASLKKHMKHMLMSSKQQQQPHNVLISSNRLSSSAWDRRHANGSVLSNNKSTQISLGNCFLLTNCKSTLINSCSFLISFGMFCLIDALKAFIRVV